MFDQEIVVGRTVKGLAVVGERSVDGVEFEGFASPLSEEVNALVFTHGTAIAWVCSNQDVH